MMHGTQSKPLTYELEHPAKLHINDSAFDKTTVTAHVGANGEIVTVERGVNPNNVTIAYGWSVEKVDTRSFCQRMKDGIKHGWEQIKLQFRKIGVWLGIIPKVSSEPEVTVTQETHPDLFPPEQAQRDVRIPPLNEHKDNSPEFRTVPNSSREDLERQRENVFRKMWFQKKVQTD
ncbi:hypothetical protein [Endozoicomonas sp. ONNA2]|uniref:hypothetical protein n=1 Tax=Endozoicomonas sp. ONNA2 TaxID=2828741 RepID=UPI002147A2C0|nr:hypothetical protein [Endozoicomonas sp. ONNA2]